jgi:hypothetical protein
MTATSTIPAVKSYLVSALQATIGVLPSMLGAGTVQVTYGWPDNAEREHVYIGGTANSDQQWAALGAKARQEDYALELVIVVGKPGSTQQEVTERAFTLLASAETALRTTPEPDGMPAGVQSLVVDIHPHRLIEGVWDDGRIAVIDSTIDIRARI